MTDKEVENNNIIYILTCVYLWHRWHFPELRLHLHLLLIMTLLVGHHHHRLLILSQGSSTKEVRRFLQVFNKQKYTD